MTLSSPLSLFRRFSRKNKRQPSEPVVQLPVEDTLTLPHGELSSSDNTAIHNSNCAAGTPLPDQHDKGERKRVAERVHGDEDASSPRRWTRKVAFDEQHVEDGPTLSSCNLLVALLSSHLSPVVDRCLGGS